MNTSYKRSFSVGTTYPFLQYLNESQNFCDTIWLMKIVSYSLCFTIQYIKIVKQEKEPVIKQLNILHFFVI